MFIICQNTLQTLGLGAEEIICLTNDVCYGPLFPPFTVRLLSISVTEALSVCFPFRPQLHQLLL